MKKLMPVIACILFFLLFISLPCISQDQHESMTSQEETLAQTDETVKKNVDEAATTESETKTDISVETTDETAVETTENTEESTETDIETTESAEESTETDVETTENTGESAETAVETVKNTNETTESKSKITITDAVICRDIVDREPVGTGDVFSKELPKVMCFTRVVGAKNETEILHNWYFAEKMMASVALRVGSENWRTYSSKAIVPEYAGEWKVEILSQDGELLKKIYFILE